MLGLFLLLVLFPAAASSWEATFGGEEYDRGHQVIQVQDGGLVIAGETESYGNGANDVYLLKTGRDGELVWERTFGYNNGEVAYAVTECDNGDVILAGTTASFAPHYDELYLIRTDPDGSLLWEQAIGGEDEEVARAVFQASDGGIVAAGTRGFSTPDVYVVKTDEDGNLLWERTWVDGMGWAAMETSDGGILIGGHTGSLPGPADMLVIKADQAGDEQWVLQYPGGGDTRVYDLSEMPDGSYVACGYDFAGGGTGMNEVCVLRVGSDGTPLGEIQYGGSASDVGHSIAVTQDGGLAICGETYSYGAGLSDVYVLEYGPSGELRRELTFGGDHFDAGNSIVQAADGDLVVAGTTMSSGAGLIDVYLINIGEQAADPDAAPKWRSLALTSFPNSFSDRSWFSFVVPRGGVFRLGVYNARGQMVDVLTPGYLEEGSHRLEWSAREGGRRLEPGVYLCCLQLGDSVVSAGRINLVR